MLASARASVSMIESMGGVLPDYLVQFFKEDVFKAGTT
jgi:hypothetical protein